MFSPGAPSSNDLIANCCSLALEMDFSHAPVDVTNAIFRSLANKDRCTCALVCTSWADAATAATCSIVKQKTRDLTSLQLWMERHGDQLEDLQLHGCYGSSLSALPCAHLPNLALHGSGYYGSISTDSRVWIDIAAATRLTSLSLAYVQTPAQQADVVSAVTALPDLQQLVWCYVTCSGEKKLSSSLLLQQLTNLTSLELDGATAAAFQHVSSLSKLQQLKVAGAPDWAKAGCPGLEGLQALTSLQLRYAVSDIPANVSQLTALQQLDVSVAKYSSLLQLHVLAGLTQLSVTRVAGMNTTSAPLPLTALQHLQLSACAGTCMPMPLLLNCEELQDLSLSRFTIQGSGPLLACSNLQRLVLDQCRVHADAAPMGQPYLSSWQRAVFPATLQLPYMTTLQLQDAQPALRTADIGAMAACCSSLQVLNIPIQDGAALKDLTQLQHLSTLTLDRGRDEQCGSLAQLTGLRELNLATTRFVTVGGWRQLAALTQLTRLTFYWLYGSSTLGKMLRQLSDKEPVADSDKKGAVGKKKTKVDAAFFVLATFIQITNQVSIFFGYLDSLGLWVPLSAFICCKTCHWCAHLTGVVVT